jgi:hypothetical protein
MDIVKSKRPVKRGKVAISGDTAKALAKAMAMDIGKEIVTYIEVMYPQAIESTSSTFSLSVRNSIHNEIMSAIEMRDKDEVLAWLAERKAFRREWLATYRNLRRKERLEKTGDSGGGQMSIVTRSFQEELTGLINRHGMDDGSGTPDFLLAEFLCDCLASWDVAVSKREKWYGRDGLSTSRTKDDVV